jgi:hypothetical protein
MARDKDIFPGESTFPMRTEKDVFPWKNVPPIRYNFMGDRDKARTLMGEGRALLSHLENMGATIDQNRMRKFYPDGAFIEVERFPGFRVVNAYWPPSPPGGEIIKIRESEGYIYAAFTESSYTWRVVKIDKITGTIIWDKTLQISLSGASAWCYPLGVAADETNVYVVGEARDIIEGYLWLRIEKRSEQDGKLEAVIFQHASDEETARTVTVSGNYVYVGGYTTPASRTGYVWKIKKSSFAIDWESLTHQKGSTEFPNFTDFYSIRSGSSGLFTSYQIANLHPAGYSGCSIRRADKDDLTVEIDVDTYADGDKSFIYDMHTVGNSVYLAGKAQYNNDTPLPLNGWIIEKRDSNLARQWVVKPGSTANKYLGFGAHAIAVSGSAVFAGGEITFGALPAPGTNHIASIMKLDSETGAVTDTKYLEEIVDYKDQYSLVGLEADSTGVYYMVVSSYHPERNRITKLTRDMEEEIWTVPFPNLTSIYGALPRMVLYDTIETVRTKEIE